MVVMAVEEAAVVAAVGGVVDAFARVNDLKYHLHSWD